MIPALFALSVLLTPSASALDEIGVRKCSGIADARFAGKPLIVVDGVVRGANTLSTLEDLTEDPEIGEIGSVEILCWDPTTNTFNDSGVGLGVIFVLTKRLVDGPHEAVQRLKDEGLRLADGSVPSLDDLVALASDTSRFQFTRDCCS